MRFLPKPSQRPKPNSSREIHPFYQLQLQAAFADEGFSDYFPYTIYQPTQDDRLTLWHTEILSSLSLWFWIKVRLACSRGVGSVLHRQHYPRRSGGGVARQGRGHRGRPDDAHRCDRSHSTHLCARSGFEPDRDFRVRSGLNPMAPPAAGEHGLGLPRPCRLKASHGYY